MNNQGVEFPYELDEEKRQKAKGYSKQKLYSGFIGGTLLPLFILSLLSFTTGANNLEHFVSMLIKDSFLEKFWIQATLFNLLLFTILYVIQLPISYYSGFLVEHKYDLSKLSKGQWAKDQLKSYMLSLLFGIPLTLGVFLLGRLYPNWWWLYAGGIMFLVLGFLSNISHLLILPLFYETNNLENKALRQDLKELCEHHGVSLEEIVKVKAGKKTEKANAAFAGMGKTKRLYLFDTLLNKFHKQEIKGIVSHELGHYLHKDVWRFIVLQGILIFPLLYLTNLIFHQWASFSQLTYLPFFLLILFGLQEIIDPVFNAYSRYRERKADTFANQTISDDKVMISAFKRLSDIDLAEIDPKEIVKLLFYDHPPLKERISKVKNQ